MRIHGRWTMLGLFLAVAACENGTGPDADGAATLAITPAADTLYAIGDTLRLSAVVRDADGAVLPEAEVEWKSLDPEVARLIARGAVVAMDTGSARIEARSGNVIDTAAVEVSATASEAELTFVRFSPEARLGETEGSFWAVAGENRELVLRYAAEGDDDGEEFLEFEVSGNSLSSRPDGTPFEDGDSIRITVRVIDAERFLFDFEPAGLRFDPDHPAELEVTYRKADPDLNDDGTVDSADEELRDRLAVWRQEMDGGLWFRIATLRLDDREEVEAEIFGFSSFCIAGA